MEAAPARVISQSWIDDFVPVAGFLAAATTLEGDDDADTAADGVFEGDGVGLGVATGLDSVGVGLEVTFGAVFGLGGGALDWVVDRTAPEPELSINDDSSTASNARAGTLLS
jgi:hypothetical protein